MIKRVAKRPPKSLIYWANSWQHQVRSRYLDVGKHNKKNVVKISAVILLADKPHRQDLFWALSKLLIGKGRKKYWRQAVTTLPKNAEGLSNFTRCVNYYEGLARSGHFQSLGRGKINPVKIIESIVKIGDAYKPYLDLYKNSFYTYPAKIFSPELIKQAGKKLRGKFGDFAEQNKELQDELEEVIETYEA